MGSRFILTSVPTPCTGDGWAGKDVMSTVTENSGGGRPKAGPVLCVKGGDSPTNSRQSRRFPPPTPNQGTEQTTTGLSWVLRAAQGFLGHDYSDLRA